MDRHAFLILAHADFEVLQYLIKVLDHTRNDIFIHFDKKVKKIPAIQVNHARLFILDQRIDISWGHVSMLDAEFALFNEAKIHGPYHHYHVLSGTHFPLRSMNSIYDYFDKKAKYSILQKLNSSKDEIDFKLGRYHFFSKYVHNIDKIHQKVGNIIWRLSLKIQQLLKIRRTKTYNNIKASQWQSLTQQALDLLLSQQHNILKNYRYTFCADEFFVASALSHHNLEESLIFDENYLQQDFGNSANPKSYTVKDYHELLQSSCLFARKFSDKDLQIVNQLFNSIKIE